MLITLTPEDFITDGVKSVSDQSLDSNEELIVFPNDNHCGYTALKSIFDGLPSKRNHFKFTPKEVRYLISLDFFFFIRTKIEFGFFKALHTV